MIQIMQPTPTKPVVSDFAWINQGTATAVDDPEGIYLNALAAAAHDLKILKKAAPSTPYTITALFLRNCLSSGNASVGLCFRQSSDGKIATFANLTWTTLRLSVWKYTDATTFSASYFDVVSWNEDLMFFRIEDDGTDRKCYVSIDGINFIQIHSIGRTDFLTADEVGFFACSLSATYPAGIKLLHWAEA